MSRISRYFEIVHGEDGGQRLRVHLEGAALIRLALTNKGTSFPQDERIALGILFRLLAALAVAVFCYLRGRYWWEFWCYRLQFNPPWNVDVIHGPPWSLGPFYFLGNASDIIITQG